MCNCVCIYLFIYLLLLLLLLLLSLLFRNAGRIVSTIANTSSLNNTTHFQNFWSFLSSWALHFFFYSEIKISRALKRGLNYSNKLINFSRGYITSYYITSYLLNFNLFVEAATFNLFQSVQFVIVFIKKRYQWWHYHRHFHQQKKSWAISCENYLNMIHEGVIYI